MADPTLDPTTKTLADPDFTVGEYLKSKFLASTLYWGARPFEGDIWSGIDPAFRGIPDLQLGASFTPQGGREKNLSVGYGDLLRYETGTREGPEGPVGRPRTDFEQVTGRVGPLEAYWERANQAGEVDRQTGKYGGSLTLGPLDLSGEQLDTTINLPIPFPEIKQRQRRASVGGQYPVGSGILRGTVGREWTRRHGVDAPPLTSADIGWTGNIGRVQLEAFGRYARRRGQDPSIGAGFIARIPF